MSFMEFPALILGFIMFGAVIAFFLGFFHPLALDLSFFDIELFNQTIMLSKLVTPIIFASTAFTLPLICISLLSLFVAIIMAIVDKVRGD